MSAAIVHLKDKLLNSTDVDNVVLDVISENFSGLSRIDFAEVVAAGIEHAWEFMRGRETVVSKEVLREHLSFELKPGKVEFPSG